MNVMRRFFKHLISFPYIWILIVALSIAALFSLHEKWNCAINIIWPSVLAIIILLVAKPLNAVYGLMGTSGSIRIFFINLIVLCFIFSGIYYWGFFKTAGVSYDINQPHIDYGMFADSASKKLRIADIWKKPFKDSTVVRSLEESKETIYIYDHTGTAIVDTLYQSTLEELYYQSIDFGTVLRNTALTFLMQEPTDLLATAVTYNADYSGKGQTIDKQKTEQLHWILILQVLIGWIFFGVFISILYNKFRYES